MTAVEYALDLETRWPAIPSAMHCGLIAEIPVRLEDVREFLRGQIVPGDI